jgi:hypothetical protein
MVEASSGRGREPILLSRTHSVNTYFSAIAVRQESGPAQANKRSGNNFQQGVN